MNAPSPLQRLGGRVRTRRRAARLSPARLAAAAGTDAVAVRAIEAGRRDPDFALLARLARALGTSVGDLLSAMDDDETQEGEGEGEGEKNEEREAPDGG